jgi:hypothetical protein
MSATICRGATDAKLDKIKLALEPYQNDHPAAAIDLYRQNKYSIRVRIIDPDLKGQDRVQRSDLAWKYLDTLSDDVATDISTVLLLTPDEIEKSFANMEFENPLPSEF